MAFPTFTWSDWKTAPTGTRFRHNYSGRTGTLVKAAKNPHNGAIVIWDDNPFPTAQPVLSHVPDSVYFVGIARDATPLNAR